ncbi:MAG: response regulator [Deltaproteobacteria bacterium]|jgi:DNA-binding response OmpR family regulator|nr:response regulator [Deltaproteobacteria bacterium]
MTEKKKILVVDDEKSMTNLLKKRIESASYDVSIASDGQEGLNKARLEMPDLIVADVMMPRLDGYHMCRLLKFDEKYKNIPIIMLTSRDNDQDRMTANAVGADAYVTKPFKGEELMSNIKKLLGDESVLSVPAT